MNRLRNRRIELLTALLLALACLAGGLVGGWALRGDGDAHAGARRTKTTVSGPSETVTTTVDSVGATLDGPNGVQVVVPPGAFDEPVTATDTQSAHPLATRECSHRRRVALCRHRHRRGHWRAVRSRGRADPT